MKKPRLEAVLLAVLFGGAIIAITAGPALSMHERKEVAGLAIVFGAEPEPALTEEVQFLRWRVSTLADEEPYGDFQDAAVTIRRGGHEYGPLTVRGNRSQPGSYQTRHIFTAAGDYESVLSFRKGDDPQVHTVDFTFTINDRAELEIPARQHGGMQDEHSGMHGEHGGVDAVVAALNAYAAAITAMDIEAAGELVTEDFLIFEGAGVNRGWADYRDHHLAPELEMFDVLGFAFSEIEAEVSGTLAWASFRYATHIEMPERVSDSAGVGSAVLVMGEDGAWRLRHLHTTPERRRQ